MKIFLALFCILISLAALLIYLLTHFGKQLFRAAMDKIKKMF